MAYSVEYVPEVVIQRLRGNTILGIFIRVATDPALHIWFGVNDIPARFDSIDEDGTIYLGGGRLIGIPTLEVLLNGISDAVEFTVSGVDPATGQAMLDDLPDVRGALVHIGITTLDDYFQPMTAILPIWQGVAARVAENMPVVSGRDAPTLTLSLSVVAGENMRSRPSRALWSSAQQRAISPSDAFCDNTAGLSRGVQPAWPNW